METLEIAISEIARITDNMKEPGQRAIVSSCWAWHRPTYDPPRLPCCCTEFDLKRCRARAEDERGLAASL